MNYYPCRGSHVFVCFIDFSTAFDTVNYWKLFYYYPMMLSIKLFVSFHTGIVINGVLLDGVVVCQVDFI